MEQVNSAENLAFNNILYIGDNGKDCLNVIEKFTLRLRKIETEFAGLLQNDRESLQYPLQRHIQYHFEGGVAVFKFRNGQELPAIIRNECLVACQSLAFEQLFRSSLPVFPLN